MTSTPEEKRFQLELDNRWIERLRSGGVDSSRMSLEILFLLPKEFIDGYREIFEEALSFQDSQFHEGVERAKGNDAKADLGPRTRSMVGASGKDVSKGRRVRTYWVLKGERALDAKTRLDRKLIRAVRTALRDLRGDLGGDQAGRCPECGRMTAGSSKR